MWLGLINEIKCWFIRTFITRNCWMPKDWTAFSWSDDEIPQWVKDANKNEFEYTIMEMEDYTNES